MGVWTSAFHGRLVIATSSAGVPGGPLVRFLCTATEFGLELAGEHLAPRLIKGGPLSVDAVQDAIRRERRRSVPAPNSCIAANVPCLIHLNAAFGQNSTALLNIVNTASRLIQLD